MNNTSKRYPAEVRERAVRMVLEHEGEYDSQWAAISSVASKLGMTPETLRKWLRTAEIDGGLRAGVSTEERARIKELERENRELRRANEILKAAAAFFGAELDRIHYHSTPSPDNFHSEFRRPISRPLCQHATVGSWPWSSND